jgi:hypothetical protein
MSIDRFRSGFLFVLAVALLVISLVDTTPPIIALAALLFLCGVGIAQLPQRAAGYVLGALTISVAAGMGAYLAHWGGLREPLLIGATSLLVAGVTGLWLVIRWSAQTPVYFSEIVYMSTIFGWRSIRGPARYKKPPFWFGRVSARISLKVQKTTLKVREVATATAEAFRDSTVLGKSTVGTRSDKLHGVDLAVCYLVDAPRWYLLYSIPHVERHMNELAPHYGGRRTAMEQAGFWSDLMERCIHEEAAEQLRTLIHKRGWSAGYVSEQRVAVAEALRATLGEDMAKYGIIVQDVELVDVQVDAPEALRDARNLALRARGHAEEVELVGDVLLELQEAFLRRVQRSLRNAGLSTADIAEIVRSQARELGWHLRQHGHLDYFLDDYMRQRRSPAGGPLSGTI